MLKSGDEMITVLAGLLGGDLNKTAAKKDDKKEDDKKDKKCPECGHKDCDCGCDTETGKGCKCSKDKDDKKKKASYVIASLSKLAGDLDEMGEDDASSLVDDALRVIVKSLESTAGLEDLEPDSELDLPVSDEGQLEEQYDEAMTELDMAKKKEEEEKFNKSIPFYDDMKEKHEDMPEDEFDKAFFMPEDEEE